uniref:Putative ovule protein n=1 Tax=Solanum chacoense TaxID=4108 RepID=A0A0V0GKB9_SOLCH
MYISPIHVFLASEHMYSALALYFHFLNLYIDIFSILYSVYRCIQQVHSPLLGFLTWKLQIPALFIPPRTCVSISC